MGHLAAGTTERREAVSPGALEEDPSGIGDHPLAERRGLRVNLLLSVLAAEG